MIGLSSYSPHSEHEERLKTQFLNALGKDAEKLLFDEDTIEIMLNEDGSLWYESSRLGMQNTGVHVDRNNAHNLINVLASINEIYVNHNNPTLECELKFARARLQAWIPPVVENPCFVIRKHLLRSVSIEELQAYGMLDDFKLSVILEAYRNKKNILIAGGTGSGKTTLISAILQHVANKNSKERFLVIQDTPEIYSKAPNSLHLNTSYGASLSDLSRSALRARPDRIIVGELRGKEAHDLLKLWNTGHPGGLSTIHSNSSEATLTRLEQLVQEANIIPQKSIIAETIDLIVYLKKTNGKRMITEMIQVEGYDLKKYQTTKINDNI